MEDVEQSGRRSEPDIRDSLSPREHQLLTLAEQGFTDHAIATKLGISLATVGTYWGRIRIKFGPLSRTELVANYLKEEASKAVAILRNDNERLVNEVTEYAKTAEILRKGVELFRGLIESAPDAILLATESGQIELANKQAAEMFGYSTDELLGMSIEALVPERYRTGHIGHREAYHQNPVKRRMDAHLATFAVRKDGSEFRMATALSAVETPTGLLITCIIRDLTDALEASASEPAAG
jgi:PAS domain S-box-containing protein